MARVHIINVSPGDCALIEHNSERITGIDICSGNAEGRSKIHAANGLLNIFLRGSNGGGNYRMCEYTSNPIEYIQKYKIGKLFRFVVSHPDMDHMDGLLRLHQEVGFSNFWDSGARRKAPDFNNGFRRYKKED